MEVTSKNIFIFGIFPYHRFFEHTLLSPIPFFVPSLTCLATCWNPIQSSKPLQSAPSPGIMVNHSGPPPEWDVNSPISVILQHFISYECQFQHFFSSSLYSSSVQTAWEWGLSFSLLQVCPLPFWLSLSLSFWDTRNTHALSPTPFLLHCTSGRDLYRHSEEERFTVGQC